MCWRSPERGLRAAAVLAIAGLAAAAHAACGDGLKSPRVLQGERHQLAWSAEPAIAAGRHFSLQVVACPAAATGAAELPLAVQATMPEHGHGMGYQPRVQRQGPGRWRVEGLMFHMKGRWELAFALGEGASAERLRDSVVLE